MKEAARQGLLGLGSKPLDSDHISQHLQDFGLDPEFSTHSRMRGLSGALLPPPPPPPCRSSSPPRAPTALPHPTLRHPLPFTARRVLC